MDSLHQRPYYFHPSILREYDIRGICGETLSTEDAFQLGVAYAQLLYARTHKTSATIAVGRDGRASSPELEKALVKGLNYGGLSVETIGVGPTPMLYFTVFDQDLDGGIMVTGSHNPPSHNGFKLMLGKKALFGEDIRTLGKIAASTEPLPPIARGTHRELAIFSSYVEALLQAYDGKRSLKIVWDAGNGAAGEVMAAICKTLPGKQLTLNETIDGSFPAHHPDPSVAENLQQLIQAVIAEGADAGFAFDGDGDRFGVVDNKGRILWGDHIMALLAGDMLAHKPGSTIIADVKASQMLFDHISAQGGTPLMWKTGHSLVKAKMADIGAPLAGEMSGHIFFADRYYGFDDGLYAAVRFLGILARMQEPLSSWLDHLPQWFNTPEMRIHCTEERKFSIVEEVRAALTAAGEEFSSIDGVRVSTKDGWWLLRASNTQAVLVARCESNSPEGLMRLETGLKEVLGKAGVRLELASGH